MRSRKPSVVRSVATVVAISALVLAGIGRLLVAAPDAAAIAIAGGAICHGAGGEAPDRGNPASNHDCCGDCALSAPGAAPAAPAFSEPVRIALAVRFDPSRPANPHGPRTWTPEQARAPPLA